MRNHLKENMVNFYINHMYQVEKHSIFKYLFTFYHLRQTAQTKNKVCEV